MSSSTPLSTKLDALLEQEYRALLSGDVEAIERHVSEKVSLLEIIGALPVEELGEFQTLREQLIRNQTLAQSAIEGMRVAIERAKEIGDVSSSLRTYKPDGRKSLIAMRSGDTLSKRS
jgi:hypothetical protein